MNKKEFIQMLHKNPELKEDLFVRAFMITNKKIDNLNEFPFYGNWNEKCINDFYFYSHNKTKITIYENNGVIFFLGGHAYNPFTMKYKEEEILSDISEAYGTDKFIEKINDLTGVFIFGTINGEKVDFLVDPSGIQSAYYGIVNNNFYITTHGQILGDMYDLHMDPFVKELINYKYYCRVLGSYLPGDLSPFSDIKRIVPGTLYTFDKKITYKRFWPLVEQKFVEGEEYNKVIEKAADILKNNMFLISKKWSKPFISLTGGIDSNTTFASANGIYDKFETFSYLSAPKEKPDAEAAQIISKKFNVKHNLYNVPDNNNEIDKFEEIKEILLHNSGYILPQPENETRKRIFLKRNLPCDVEVKSWVSDNIRAYWYYYFGRKSFPKLSPKLFRNLYKIFITNRSLAHKLDKLFDKFIKDFEFEKIPQNYPPADMHFNDVSAGSWGSGNISEMKYYTDVTFIYCNRKFFDLMYSIPLIKRITCRHHLDMKKILNKELYNMNSRVVNMTETKNRARMLNLIFDINMKLPF